MGHHREDIVERALQVMDDYGLASLTMRRLGSELGLQPSALYHHFANKQTLLAAVADEVLDRGRRRRSGRSWQDTASEVCHELRDAMLAYRDGADLVPTVYAFGLGARAPHHELVRTLRAAGFSDALVDVGASTLLHFTFGHTFEEQTALQAESAGAVSNTRLGSTSGAGHFELGLDLLLVGLASHTDSGSSSRSRERPRVSGRRR